MLLIGEQQKKQFFFVFFNLFSTDFDDASFKAATELIDDSDKYCERLYKDPFKKLDDESLWR